MNEEINNKFMAWIPDCSERTRFCYYTEKPQGEYFSISVAYSPNEEIFHIAIILRNQQPAHLTDNEKYVGHWQGTAIGSVPWISKYGQEFTLFAHDYFGLSEHKTFYLPLKFNKEEIGVRAAEECTKYLTR